MQLNLEVSDRLVRKLKALNALEGGMYAANLEGLVVSMMEEAVNTRILQLLDVTTVPAFRTPFKLQVKDFKDHEDSSGIADGLGDDDDDVVPPETDEEALVPSKGGLTDEVLEHDMDLADPEHEAAEEAPEIPDGVKSDNIFSQMVGLPLPPEDDDPEEAHAARRRQRPKLKAKVRGMTEDYDSSSF